MSEQNDTPTVSRSEGEKEKQRGYSRTYRKKHHERSLVSRRNYYWKNHPERIRPATIRLYQLWTAEEIELLMANYAHAGPNIPELLDIRSRNSIKGKAMGLGLNMTPMVVGRVEMPPWTETEAAYIAGIIDGEGCIGVYQRGKPHGGTNSVFINLSVINTYHSLISWLATMFGLSEKSYVRTNTPLPNRKVAYVVCVRGKRVYQILVRVKPYLRVKVEQAELVIQYREWRLGIIVTGHKFTLEQQAHIDQVVMRRSELNRRGPPSIDYLPAAGLLEEVTSR